MPGGLLRGLVVAAELVRQPGVRVGGDAHVGDPGELGQMRTQLLGAECAVESDRERPGVAHGVPEGRRRLPGQRAAGGSVMVPLTIPGSSTPASSKASRTATSAALPFSGPKGLPTRTLAAPPPLTPHAAHRDAPPTS